MRFALVTTPEGLQFALNSRNILDILPPTDAEPSNVRCRLNIRSWYMDEHDELMPNVHLVYCQETVAEVLAQVNG